MKTYSGSRYPMLPINLVVNSLPLACSLDIPKSDIFPSNLLVNKMLLLLTSLWMIKELHPVCR